jgi:hypothetical protein
MAAPVPQIGDPVPVFLDTILINVQNCEKPIPNPKGRHCALNVLDIFKDARIDPDATGSNLLNEAMLDIFPHPSTCYKTGDNYSVNKLHQEEQIYMNDKAITGDELRIAALSKKALNDTVLNNEIDTYIKSEFKDRIPDFISGSIPETYEYALNDAAITPNDFRPGIQEIETPGSYIDPGGRKIGDYTWPQDNQELKIDLTNFGFENIIFYSTFFFNAGDQTRYCRIILKKGETVLMNVVVNRTGEIVYPPNTPTHQQYFLGNNIKNKFLTTRSDKANAINFVLGKELGDTLQVIIGYIMMKANPMEYNEKTLAAFTGDIPFACRCMMLNLPVLLRRLKYNSKNSVLRHYSFFTPLNLRPEEKLIMINNAKIDDIIKHNVGVIFRIRRFNAEPNIEDYIGDTRKVKPEAIKDRITLLLNDIIEYIEYINAHLVQQRGSHIYDINVYEGYRAFDVCSVIKKKTKLNPLLTRLMDNISDPISGTISGTISDPITKILAGNNCRTTGEYYKKIHKIVHEETKERNNAARDARRLNIPGGSKYSDASQRTPGALHSTLGASKRTSSASHRTPRTSARPSLKQIRYNVYKAEEYSYYIVDILFNYYKYVRGTIIGSDFFGLVTQSILETGLLTLSDFEQIYDNFKNVEFDLLPNIGKDDNYDSGYNYDSGDIFETNTNELRKQMYNFLLQSDFFETYLNTIYTAEAPPPPIVVGSRSNKSSIKSMKALLGRHSLSKNSTRALPPFLSTVYEGGRKERKHKTRKHKTRKHKTRKHKTRKHKTRKHKPRKHKTRKHKTRKNRK